MPSKANCRYQEIEGITGKAVLHGILWYHVFEKGNYLLRKVLPGVHVITTFLVTCSLVLNTHNKIVTLWMNSMNSR